MNQSLLGSFWESNGGLLTEIKLEKTIMKNRNIKPETAGQALADFITEKIARHHFTLVVLVQVCLALSAAVPVTVNGFQPFPDNVTAESDTAFPAEGRWIPTGSLNSARAIHTATLLPNGLVLVAGGLNTRSVESRSAELYNPVTGTWTVTGSLNDGRFYYPATLLPNGKVLVEGGDSLAGERASAELYDSATGTWTRTGTLNVARQLHSATLLQDGRVLVAGGFSNGFIINSVELYDPATGTWTVGNGLNIARFTHTANLLRNGKVLVAGDLVAAALWLARNCLIRRPEPGQPPAILTPRALLTPQQCCAVAK
jgi:hypothetical protein